MYIAYSEQDEGETSVEAEREVKATQQKNITTKEAFAACNILQKYAASQCATFDVNNSICTLGNLIEFNFQQNLKPTKLADYFKPNLIC